MAGALQLMSTPAQEWVSQLCGISLRSAGRRFSPRRHSSQHSYIAVDIAAHANSSINFNHGPHCAVILQQLQKPLEACQAVWHQSELPDRRLLTAACEPCRPLTCQTAEQAPSGFCSCCKGLQHTKAAHEPCRAAHLPHKLLEVCLADINEAHLG